MPLHKFILNRFLGISPLVARELAFRATGRTDTPVATAQTEDLFLTFADFIRIFDEHDYVPTLAYGEDDTPVEFCFTELRQYGAGVKTERFPTFGALLDAYFATSLRKSSSAGRTSFIFCRTPMRASKENWMSSARSLPPVTRGRLTACTAISLRQISIS